MSSKNPDKLEGNAIADEGPAWDPQSSGVRQAVILVADDDVNSRKLVSSLMQKDGHCVLTAADGHDGLEVARQYAGSIDLVIADVQMPRLNGPELCAHLLEERPGIKVMFISSATLSEFVPQDVNLPLLTKPIDGDTLMAKVRAILAASVQPLKH